MKCYKCPYIREQFDDRIQRLDGSDLCGLIEYDEAEYDHVDYCYCEKMGHDLYAGRCDDAEHITEKEWVEYREEHGLPPTKIPNPVVSDEDVLAYHYIITSKQKKRVGDKKHRKRMDRIYDTVGRHWIVPFWPVYENDEFWREEWEHGKTLYYKHPGRNHYKRWLKKQSNKKIRRKGEPTKKRGLLHKLFDFWWELW